MHKKQEGFIRLFLVSGFVLSGLISCSTNSSPEGRMTEKLENLQKEMLDSIQKQNRAILDSLGKIREEINALKGNKSNK